MPAPARDRRAITIVAMADCGEATFPNFGFPGPSNSLFAQFEWEEQKTKLQTRIDEAQAKLGVAVERAKATRERFQRETDAKIKVLQDQRAMPKAESKLARMLSIRTPTGDAPDMSSQGSE